MNSGFQVFLLGSVRITLHKMMELLMFWFSENWTQAMFGECCLLYILCSESIPVGAASVPQFTGKAVYIEMSEVVCTVPYLQPQCARAWCRNHFIILHLCSLI